MWDIVYNKYRYILYRNCNYTQHTQYITRRNTRNHGPSIIRFKYITIIWHIFANISRILFGINFHFQSKHKRVDIFRWCRNCQHFKYIHTNWTKRLFADIGLSVL